MNKRQNFSFSIGTSSIILIFLVLCLTVFSVLSLSSAAADDNLSERMAERTTAYYKANTDANNLLGSVDEILQTSYWNAADENAYYRALPDALSSVPDIDVSADAIPVISWQVSITDEQILSVSITPVYPSGNADGFYEITCWKTINTADWTPDTKQNVFRLGN